MKYRVSRNTLLWGYWMIHDTDKNLEFSMYFSAGSMFKELLDVSVDLRR